jgi:tetratricopeptide (TPR) repeat protein
MKFSRTNLVAFFILSVCLFSACASLHYDKGLDASNKGDYTKAIKEYTKSLEIMKKNPGGVVDDEYLYWARAIAYLYAGDPNAARNDIGAFIRSNPSSNSSYFGERLKQHTYVSTAAHLAWRRGQKAIDDKNYSLAIEEFTQAIELAPYYATAYESRGDTYFEGEDYNNALGDYNNAIKLNPTLSPNTYMRLGEIYYNRGDYDSAKVNLNKSLALVTNEKAFIASEDRIKINDLLAKATANTNEQNQQVRLASAQKDYDTANTYRDKNDYTNAIFYYREALKNNPGHDGAKNNLKIVWDKRIAENPNPYPAPFAGKWKYVIRAAFYAPSRTESYSATENYSVPMGESYILNFSKNYHY